MDQWRVLVNTEINFRDIKIILNKIRSHRLFVYLTMLYGLLQLRAVEHYDSLTTRWKEYGRKGRGLTSLLQCNVPGQSGGNSGSLQHSRIPAEILTRNSQIQNRSTNHSTTVIIY
jgi:hypothetical protein